MPEYFCSCGYWAQSGGALMSHLRENSGHHRIDKRRWKKLVEQGELKQQP